MRWGLSLSVGLLALLSGCASSPVELSPIGRGRDFTAHQVLDPNSGGVFESITAIAGGRLTFRVVKASGDRLASAQVTLLGPTPSGGTTPSNLDLTFQPLDPGTYYARVSAPGYIPQLIGPLSLDSKTPLTQVVTLAPDAGDIVGRVLDASNNPLAGARVNLGEAYAFSGSDGTFRLTGVSSGGQSVAIAKTGYASASVAVTIGSGDSSVGDVHLAMGTKVVSIENNTQSFAGSNIGTALGALRDAIIPDGFTLQNGAAAADVRVVASPTASWAGDVTARTESLRQFVLAGGKLVLLGEWGGASDYSPGVLNAIAHPYGIGFNTDLVQINAGSAHAAWLSLPTVGSVLPAPVAIGSGVQMFDACSIFAPAPAQPLLSTGSGGFRIATIMTGDLKVGVVRPYGRGLVIALGDTSAWTTPGTRNGNASNLDEASNRAFVRDLFLW
jgi:hypothetical protein